MPAAGTIREMRDGACAPHPKSRSAISIPACAGTGSLHKGEVGRSRMQPPERSRCTPALPAWCVEFKAPRSARERGRSVNSGRDGLALPCMLRKATTNRQRISRRPILRPWRMNVAGFVLSSPRNDTFWPSSGVPLACSVKTSSHHGSRIERESGKPIFEVA